MRLAEQMISKLSESMSRYCGIWKANNGRWYLDLAPNEYDGYDKAITYGSFSSEEAAEKYLEDNFSNPGSMDIDDEGRHPPPTKSPNGSPVQKGGSSMGLNYLHLPPMGRYR